MNIHTLHNIQEAYLEVYDNIMEKEDSPYEKASDAALDARYGYGRASGDKRSFGRAANRSSAAAALRAIRRGKRSGSGTSREAGADAVHQGWARTAKTSTDQTPEKKERRAKLANTPYSHLPDDEKEKDRVSFDAVRAVYNRNKTQKEEFDIYGIILSHLLDEGYAETYGAAEKIMVNMSEEWVDDILEALVDTYRTRNMGSEQAKKTKRFDRTHRNEPSHPGTHTPRSYDREPQHQASRGVRGTNSRNKQIMNRENPKPGKYLEMQRDNPVEKGRSIAHGKKDVASRTSARKYIQKALDDAGIQRPGPR